jgi:hypothetical protein
MKYKRKVFDNHNLIIVQGFQRRAFNLRRGGKEAAYMKYRIIIEIESDKKLNLLAQHLKNSAEEAVIEILSKTKANTFVDSSVGQISR